MKKGVVLTLLVGLLIALTTPGAGNEEADVAYPEVSRITAEELKQLMDKKSEYVLVDTRDSESYNQGHIKGAINIHYNPVGDPVAREMMLLALPMDELIIVYCS